MSGLTEALAGALIESDLIRRYSEYAIDAHEFTMAREGFDVLADQWAAAILADPAFREALTREVAEAIADEPWTKAGPYRAVATGIVARLLGDAR